MSVTLLALTIVGIPWAIATTARWWFAARAMFLDDAEPREARLASERLVAGRWWRTAAACLLLALVAVAQVGEDASPRWEKELEPPASADGVRLPDGDQALRPRQDRTDLGLPRRGADRRIAE